MPCSPDDVGRRLRLCQVDSTSLLDESILLSSLRHLCLRLEVHFAHPHACTVVRDARCAFELSASALMHPTSDSVDDAARSVPTDVALHQLRCDVVCLRLCGESHMSPSGSLTYLHRPAVAVCIRTQAPSSSRRKTDICSTSRLDQTTTCVHRRGHVFSKMADSSVSFKTGMHNSPPPCSPYARVTPPPDYDSNYTPTPQQQHLPEHHRRHTKSNPRTAASCEAHPESTGITTQKRNYQLSTFSWLLHTNLRRKPRYTLFNSIQFVLVLCYMAAFGLTTVGSQGVVGTIPRCEAEGDIIVVPGITNSRCTCKCMGNEVVCDSEKCRRPTTPPKQPSVCDTKMCRDVEGCRVILFPPGPCCRECKGCRYQRKQYESGDTWRDSKDPCKQLSCQAGVVTISRAQCFTHCHSSLPVPGQCCPVCQGCYFRGKLYTESETFQLPTDACTTCTCKDGSLLCERQQCPVLNCKSDYIYRPKGECCSKCRGTRDIFDPKGCFFADHVYNENERFSPEPCTQCRCRKRGTTVCDKIICPPLDCPPAEQIRMNNSGCCMKCLERRDCMFEGNGYKNKEEWRPNVCMQCSCVDGVTYCQREKCSNSLWCPQGYKLMLTDKECCPKCIEHDAVCSVFGDPHYRTFDGLMYSFQGTCKYILAQDCANKDFLIKVKNAVRYSSGFAWTQMLVVFLFGHRVSMLHNSVVKVDRARARLPYSAPGKFSIAREGLLVKLKSSIGLEVTWDGDSFLEVTVAAKYKHRMCGLCGNYNGIKSDDLIGKDGAMYMSGQQSGHTWRVGSKSACHIETDKVAKAPCEMNSTARGRAQQACKLFYSQAFSKCRSKVAVHVYVSSCITDMCDCPQGHSCACEAIMAYISQCSRAGINVKVYKPSTCQSLES